jgi:type II secretory pathway pseudopilin PulG
MREQIYRQISKVFANRKLVRGFTISELLVAMGLLAAVMAVSSVIFNYSIDAQRTASATSEIMRTLRAITDQLNINFGDPGAGKGGLKTDGYLILHSEQINPPANDHLDALYFFSGFLTDHFQSWDNPAIEAPEARIFLGHSQTTFALRQLPGYLALDFLLLKLGGLPDVTGDDYVNADFAQIQPGMINMTVAIAQLDGEIPADVLSNATNTRPDASSTNNIKSLLAQNVGSFKIEWTYGWFDSTAPDKILWWGLGSSFLDAVVAGTNFLYTDGSPVPAGVAPARVISINETSIPGPPKYYTVDWNTTNQADWPRALKFTFTLYDSKGILKNGRTFEHIIYIGN